MEKERAIIFASLMQNILNIPSMVCEAIERKLIEGNYEEVVNFVVDKRIENLDKLKVLEVEEAKKQVDLEVVLQEFSKALKQKSSIESELEQNKKCSYKVETENYNGEIIIEGGKK